VAFSGNIRAFVDLRHFAVTATVAGVSVSGHFDRAYAEFGGISGTAPAFHCILADLPSIYVDQQLVIEGVGSFRIRVGEPDGAGMVTLILEEL
jgi:hypothetical protein